jgi:hypothetical protein
MKIIRLMFQLRNATICPFVFGMYHLYGNLMMQLKWTAVSQQRLVSIVTNTENTQTTVTLQGGPSEAIQVAVYHPSLPSAIVDCRIFQSNGQAQLVISPSTVICN